MILNKVQFAIAKMLISLISVPIIYYCDRQLPSGMRLPALLVFVVVMFFIARRHGVKDQARAASKLEIQSGPE